PTRPTQSARIGELTRIAKRCRMEKKEIAFQRYNDFCALEVILRLDTFSEELVECHEFGVAIDRFILMPLRRWKTFQDSLHLPGCSGRCNRAREKANSRSSFVVLTRESGIERFQETTPRADLARRA